MFGDALANLLAFAGYAVTREYYINDGGAQIETLARSIHHRYREALGEDVGPRCPTGCYPGDYLIPVARQIAEARRRALAGRRPRPNWLRAASRRVGVEAMLPLIRDDLAALGVRHDVFTSERDADRERRASSEALAALDAKGLRLHRARCRRPRASPVEDWEPVPQLLFRSTAFGDDDRPPAQALERRLDLFRGRPRLPLRQDPPRLRR